MNYSKVRNEHIITDIVRENIKFTNLAAKDNGSIYYNARNHDLQLWVDELPELIDNLLHEGVKIRTIVFKHCPNCGSIVSASKGNAFKPCYKCGSPIPEEVPVDEERNYIKLRAYPKIKVFQGKDGVEREYPSPRMSLRFPDGTETAVMPDSINLVDEAIVDNNALSVGISFHTFEENRFHTMVCNIDEIIVFINDPSLVGNRPSRDDGEPRSFLAGVYNK